MVNNADNEPADIKDFVNYAVNKALQCQAELRVLRHLLHTQGIVPDAAEYDRLCQVELEQLAGQLLRSPGE